MQRHLIFNTIQPASILVLLIKIGTMKTIIVCTDFSQEAENAVHYAASMAKENQYNIILFNLQSISIHALNAQASADFSMNKP
jgi:ribosomal protein L30E